MTAAGAKIIEGLKDAVAGNFSAVTIEGQRWVRTPEWRSIETAPPAGTNIDVWMVLPSGHGARWTSVMWGDQARRWIGGPPSQDEKGWKATHWMPIPESPVST